MKRTKPAKPNQNKEIKEMKKATAKIASSYVPSKGSSSWLIVVESPSKCKKIEEYLGPDYKCIATLGHLQYIEGLNAIELKDQSFHIQYSVIPEKADHVQHMHRLISVYPSNRVLIATDDDREGEAIAWHILTLFHLPPDTPRIKFHEITRPALAHAVQNPTVVDQALVQSQQARQVIDMLIGFKISPLLWKYVCHSKKDALSAGRCQTVALRLVYENSAAAAANETKSAEKEKRWKTVGFFTCKDIPFVYSQHLPETDLLQLYNRVQSHPLFTLSLGEKRRRTVAPPKPLTTARLLQQYTSVSPSRVMSLCQILYQEGYITYMRTDTENYSAVFLQQVQAFLHRSRLEFGSENPCCLQKEKEKEKEGPHEAIRATCLDTAVYTGPIGKDHCEALNTLYKFIWRNTIQSCMPPATFDDVEVRAQDHEDRQQDRQQDHPEGFFAHTLEIPVKHGWTAFGAPQEVASALQASTLLFFQSLIAAGNESPCLRLESTCLTERPPKHYSEASLIAQLEKRGIGRPSTYAYLVDTIVQRGYVKITDIEGVKTPCCNYSVEINEGGAAPKQSWTDVWVGKENNRLVIQTVGIMTMEFLMTYFDTLFSYDYTRQMEGALDEVAENRATKQGICLGCRKAIDESMIPLRTVERRSLPKIDDRYDFIIQKFGNSLRDGAGQYHPVKNMKLDLVRLHTPGGYSADDLLEFPSGTDCLGKYRGEDVFIKKGPFGWFIRYGSHPNPVESVEEQEEEPEEEPEEETTGKGTISIPKGVDIHRIQLSDVISWIEKPPTEPLLNGERKPPTHPEKTTVLRTLDASCSVRTGKYGPFVMMTPPPNELEKKKGKKPKVQFHNLKKFAGDYLTCPKEDLLQYMEKGPG